MNMPYIPPQNDGQRPAGAYRPPGEQQWPGVGWQTPGHYGQPAVNVFATTTQPAPRQSCMVHALLLVTTLGIGNVVYSVWHRNRHGR